MGVSPLCVHLSVRCDAYLARGAHVSEVQKPVPRFLHISKLCPVPPILLPERLLIQAAGFGRTKSAGPHSGGISVLDVERPHFPFAVPLFWPFLAAVQRNDPVSLGRT